VNPRLTAPRPGAPKRRHRLPLFPEPDHVHRRPRARYPGAEDDLARLVLMAEHYSASRAGPRAKFYSYTRLCVHAAACGLPRSKSISALGFWRFLHCGYAADKLVSAEPCMRA
jgi:hypothetical protein